ncbi:MAG TPA: hypothetical protein VN428_02145, partial [Bryobacteraceae bacterium]|nr:hypothetical protein [Bryobacteraceae bacterium]
CPPVKALLHIMAHGAFEGMGISDPRLRSMFTRDSLFASAWYKERLRAKQARDVALWRRHVESLESFLAADGNATPCGFNPESRLREAREQLAFVSASGYAASLHGTIGADPGLA